MGCCNSKDDQHKAAMRKRHGSVSIMGDSSSGEFDPEKNFRVFMATWNVGDAEPASMKPLFEHINDCGGNMDLIVVAAQECKYTPTDGSDLECNEHWYKLIESLLPDYTLVTKKGMWTMRIAVFAKNEIKDHVKDIIVSREATGVGSVGGNKGGVAVGLTCYDTRLLFVGSHLAAHLEHVEQRNSDFYEIIEGIDSCFRIHHIEPLNYFHHVFWCGDLNYRIDGMSAEDVIKNSYEMNIDALLPHDQLINEMKKGNVFNNFQEAGTPHFTPTYRFLRDTKGEQREYDPWKSRVPSWCDRILTKSLGAHVDTLKCLKYTAEHAVRSSDHSPVFAIYDVRSRERAREKINLTNIPKKKYTLSLTNVHAEKLLNADSISLSDPYIVFRVEGLEQKCKVQTNVIDDSLNPNWGNKVFELDLGKRNDIPLHYLHCVMMDKDQAQDDPIGQAVFPLEKFFSDGDDTRGKKIDVQGPILHGGKQHGTLYLSATLKEEGVEPTQ